MGTVAEAPGGDGALERRLAERLEHEPDVLVAYVFGSIARGTAGALSDVDVAVLLSEGVDAGRRQLELLAAVGEVTAPRRADVVILNEAPVSLGYRVLRDGRLLLSRDDDARIEHWASTVDRYIDMAPMRRALEEGQRHRLEEGRFGRP